MQQVSAILILLTCTSANPAFVSVSAFPLKSGAATNQRHVTRTWNTFGGNAIGRMDSWNSLRFHLYANEEKHNDYGDDDYYYDSQNSSHGKEEIHSQRDANIRRYFATCIPGLAPILADELVNLGAHNVLPSGSSGVYFTNNPSDSDDDIDIGMKALLWARTAHRIMEQIVSTEDFDDWTITDRDSLENFIHQTVPVQSLLGDGRGGLLTLSVSTTLNGGQSIPKELCHSHYTSLTVKNAVVDVVRDMREDGLRPDVDLVDPDVPLLLVLRGSSGKERRGDSRRNRGRKSDIYDYGRKSQGGCQATLFRLLHSGGSLHKRGYRVSTVHKAAMKESLAAGLLMEAGYHKLIAAAKEDGLPAVLLDPMAGSGTFCVEAALIASDFAPGLMRMKRGTSDDDVDDNGRRVSLGRDLQHQVPPVVRWKGSNRNEWKRLVLEARDRAEVGVRWMREPANNCIIMGNEYNPGAASLALGNIAKAGFGDCVMLNEGDCINWDLGGKDEDSLARIVVPGRTIVTCNPPWGLRLTEDIEDSWLSLKSFLREQCNSAVAWVLSGIKATTRFLRMKKSRSVVIKTADEDLRWIQYHIFKKKTQDNEFGKEQRKEEQRLL